MTIETGEPSTEPTTEPLIPSTEAPTTEVTETPKTEEAPAYEPLTVEALKLPGEEDGFQIDETLRDDFLSLVNNQELTPAERAQSLLDLHVKAIKDASEKGSAAWDQLQVQWREQVEADPEIGGSKLEPALASVHRAIDKFGSPEVRQAMDLTGAGNNPAIVKFIYNMAKQFDEGTPVSGNATSGGQSLADKLYPTMKGN